MTSLRISFLLCAATLIGCASAPVASERAQQSATSEAASAGETAAGSEERREGAFVCPGSDTSASWLAGNITYAVEGEPDSTIRWSGGIAGGDEQGVLFEAEFTVRAVAGYAQGTEHYRCTPSGLALEAVRATDGIMAFEPPLVVLPVASSASGSNGVPSDGGVGVQAGSAWLSAPGSDSRRYDARHAWEFEEIAPHGPLGALFERHVRVRSVLLLDGEGASYEVETETDWGLDAGRGAVLARRQVIRVDGVVLSRRAERARTLTP